MHTALRAAAIAVVCPVAPSVEPFARKVRYAVRVVVPPAPPAGKPTANPRGAAMKPPPPPAGTSASGGIVMFCGPPPPPFADTARLVTVGARRTMVPPPRLRPARRCR